MADKELHRMRPDFVDKVSIEVIKQLLDGLLVDGVFNDGEKDSVLEENPSKRDKARALIDVVKRKGPEASRRMIDRLQKLDQTLYCELGLSRDQPAQPAPAEPVNQRELAPPVPTVKEFWMSKKDDPKVYPVTQSSFRNRVALLITNIKFSNESMNRRGAEIDEENMEKLLSSLGYEVVKYTDLTGKAIDEALMKFIKHPKLKVTDSVFVVIMSHGKLGKILGVNWTEDNLDEFPINNIFKHLGSKSCPALINKPKVIIIQACRGEQRGSVLVSDGPNTADDVPQTEDFEADELHFVHPEKDFISLLSCTPDIELFRHHGSLFIRRIAEVFEWCSHHDDISELFSKILEFPKYFEIQWRPIIRCTLTKRFYPSIARGFYGMGNEVLKFSESETSSSVKHKYHISCAEGGREEEETFTVDSSEEEDEEEHEDSGSCAEGGREEEAPRFQFCCEKCKAITQTHGQEIVTPQRIANGCFQLQLEEEGQYECSVTGLVFEANDCQANLKQKPSQRAKPGRLRTRCSSDDQNAYGAESTNSQVQDLSEKQLLQISKMFGSEWMQVAIYLGLMYKDLEDIKETESDVTMQKFKMLVKWKNGRNRGEATANDLWDGVKDLDVLPSEVPRVLQDLMDRQTAR